jgi:hypothetical protein
MLNKSLLIVLLLAAPSFAIMLASQAHNNADSANKVRYEKQLPVLLNLIDKQIQESYLNGRYQTEVEVSGYDFQVVDKASNTLAALGYTGIYSTVDQRKGWILHIEW